MRTNGTYQHRLIANASAPDWSPGATHIAFIRQGAPWIATADTIPDPHALTISCAHGGRGVTEDSTANLLYQVADVICYLSGYLTLEPGDVIAMGTALKPSASGGSAVQNVDLVKLGGPIEVTISGIGTLSNPVEMA